MIHKGGCHCGAVKFRFTCEQEITVQVCNCSLCYMIGFQHLIIPLDRFEPLDETSLTLYTFNTGVAKHYFCSVCGVKSWYVPRSNPDGISINYRCVEPGSFSKVQFEDFDGQNWQANASSLAHLSVVDRSDK